jgi:hypothetical protein
MDGKAYLEKLIADRLGAKAGQPVAGRRMGFDRTEIGGIAQGLVAAGALSVDDMRRMLADLDATLTAAGWLVRVEHRMEGPRDASLAMPTRVEPAPGVEPVPGFEPAPGAARPEWTARIEDPPVPRLRRVVPLAGRTVVMRPDEEPATLISLEVWTTILVLRLARPLPAEQVRRPWEALQIGPVGAWDDAGTRYRGTGANGSGHYGLHVENRTFEPGPPDHATELTIEIGTARMRVPLL